MIFGALCEHLQVTLMCLYHYLNRVIDFSLKNIVGEMEVWALEGFGVAFHILDQLKSMGFYWKIRAKKYYCTKL